LPLFPEISPGPSHNDYNYAKELSGKLNIKRIKVYSYPIGSSGNLLDSIFNTIHWKTESQVIRAELPFNEGDKVTKEDLLEAERVLRNLNVLKRARVMYEKDTGDVIIYTQDNLSLLSYWSVESQDEYYKFLLSVNESNFLGRLYGLGFDYQLENFIHSYNVRLSQPRLAGLPLSISVSSGFSSFQQKMLSSSNHLSIKKPFRFLSDRHSYGVSYSQSKGNYFVMKGATVGTFEDPETGDLFASSYFQESRTVDLEYIYGYGLYNRVEISSGFGFEKRKNFFIDKEAGLKGEAIPNTSISNSADGLLSEKLEAYYYRAGLKLLNRDYMIRRNFRRYLLIEDIEFGSFIGLNWQHALPVVRGDTEYYRSNVFLQHVVAKPGWQLEFASSLGAQYFKTGSQRGWQNETRVASSRAFLFRESGVFASRVKVATAFNLSEGARLNFFKGFVRGFNFQNSSVNSGFVTSVEWRTLPLVTDYLAFGAVAFSDVAYLTGENSDYYASIGLGLRAGFYRYDKNLFRIDLAVPLTKNSSSNLNFSIGLSHAF
jgi:hypothetical protein